MDDSSKERPESEAAGPDDAQGDSGALASDADGPSQVAAGGSTAPVAPDATPENEPPLEQQPTVIRKSRELPRLAARPTDLARGLEGQRLGRYRLDEFVGGGGMGAVFRGHDLELSRTVAIKVVPCEATDADALRRFKNEAQSAARLDHARIARVFNVGADEHWHYIVFEFIEGVNIRDLVQHKGPLSLDEALLYTRQVAEALDHASKRDVVHRDIKPSNVLVMQDGTAKVVDFGLARLHHVESASEDLTQSGMMFGTFDFIPPEQAKDPRATDVRSDLYSLGCTLYYMLAGQAPFPDGTVLQKLLRHSSETPARIETHRPDVPSAVGDIVDRLLKKRQDDRFQTPAELIEALDSAAASAGISLSDSPAPVSLPQSPQPNFLLQHVVWLVPMLALGVLAAALEWPSPSRTTPDPPGLRLLPAVSNTASNQGAPASPESVAEAAVSAPPAASVKVTEDAGEATLAVESEAAGPPALSEELVVVNVPLDPQRLVVQLDGAPAVAGVASVNSLEAAVKRLNSSPDLRRIELRFDGALASAPIRLAADREIEFVAGEGFRPRITFAAPGGEQGRSMIAISDGQWRFQGVHFEMRLPDDYPAEQWALFQMQDDARRLDVFDSVMTVLCDNPKLHDHTSFLQVTSRDSKDMPESPSGRMAPVASFNDCVARGDASLIHSPAGSPLICHFNQSLLASSRYILEAAGSMVKSVSMPTMKNTLRVTMDQSTIFAQSGGAVVDMQNAAQLPALNLYFSSCAIDCPGTEDRPTPGLIVHRYVEERNAAENFTQLGGVDNLLSSSLQNHHVPESSQPDGWPSNAIGVAGDAGPAWQAPIATNQLSAEQPSDFTLADDDKDQNNAGAPMDVLMLLFPTETP